jgi:hypothetical protein
MKVLHVGTAALVLLCAAIEAEAAVKVTIDCGPEPDIAKAIHLSGNATIQ